MIQFGQNLVDNLQVVKKKREKKISQRNEMDTFEPLPVDYRV